MAELLNRCPVEIDICVTRGDTEPFGFNMLEPDGVTPSDLTGNTYKFTVSSEKSPKDTVNQIFENVPTFLGNVVTVALSDVEADNVGNYYYNLQKTSDVPKPFTEIKGKITFEQDVTK
jgi:hypothetical protein